MLNNKDFASLLSNPDSIGKTRFDLKQVEKWDKEIESKFKKKPPTKGVKSSNKLENDEKDVLVSQSYRDRALERRKQILPEEERNLETIAASLDAEQSKFLGGDVEHTHLVKGLDYALLRKNRENSELLSSQFLPLAQTNPSSKNDLTIDSSEISKKKSIQIETLMGINIYQILELNTRKLSNNTGLPASQIASSSTTAGHGAPNTKSAIKLNPITTRLTVGSRGYEFDLRPSSNDDMPTEVSRSKLEYESQRTIHYAMPANLLEKLSICIEQKMNAKKRKKLDSADSYSSTQFLPAVKSSGASDNTLSVSGKQTKQPGIPISIYDDIFEDVGKYEPVGALTAEDKMLAGITLQPTEITHVEPSWTNSSSSSFRTKMDDEMKNSHGESFSVSVGISDVMNVDDDLDELGNSDVIPSELGNVVKIMETTAKSSTTAMATGTTSLVNKAGLSSSDAMYLPSKMIQQSGVVSMKSIFVDISKSKYSSSKLAVDNTITDNLDGNSKTLEALNSLVKSGSVEPISQKISPNLNTLNTKLQSATPTSTSNSLAIEANQSNVIHRDILGFLNAVGTTGAVINDTTKNREKSSSHTNEKKYKKEILSGKSGDDKARKGSSSDNNSGNSGLNRAQRRALQQSKTS